MDRNTSHSAGCTISGAEKLPPGTGGADALCAVIAKATRSAGAMSVAVEVRVFSAHMMAATQTLADGRKLPEVKTARADRPLGRSSFDMLATALADQLAATRD